MLRLLSVCTRGRISPCHSTELWSSFSILSRRDSSTAMCSIHLLHRTMGSEAVFSVKEQSTLEIWEVRQANVFTGNKYYLHGQY